MMDQQGSLKLLLVWVCLLKNGQGCSEEYLQYISADKVPYSRPLGVALNLTKIFERE